MDPRTILVANERTKTVKNVSAMKFKITVFEGLKFFKIFILTLNNIRPRLSKNKIYSDNLKQISPQAYKQNCR